MPDSFARTSLARSLPQGVTTAFMCAALLTLGSGAQAAPVPATDAPKAASFTNSTMDAPLFYQLLMGELELQSGDAGNAFQIMLDAARRTGDEALFRRVVGIALRARAGDQALMAARAWRDQLPESSEAAQTAVQLLVGLNRLDELSEPLSDMLRLTPTDRRSGAIAALPHLLQRSPEPLRVLATIEPLLRPYLQQPATLIATHVALARFTLAAGDRPGALALLQTASDKDPSAEAPALVALDMMETSSQAESLVRAHLLAKPDSDLVRLNYARVLARTQRHADAIRELTRLTRSSPDLLGAWISLGMLQLELKHPVQAEAAFKTYLGRAETARKQGAEGPELSVEARQQAYLLLAQAAEQRGDLKAAEGWLALVGDTKQLLQLQYRRASVLSRQGKLADGRKLLQDMPARTDEDVKAKLMAEVQLLREARQWQAAYEVLAAGNKRFTDDVDLLYEQSMLAEKLNRMDEMESLLRRVIALKPDYQHAYNALGYSLADRNVRLVEAKQLIEKALSLSPSEPFLLDSLGWVEFRMGRNDEAERLLSQAYRSRPDTEIAAHLGEVLWVMGKQEDARRIWREGAQRDHDNEVLLETLARLHVSL